MQPTNEYIFQHPWETVIKGFWNKYPSKDMNFVKFNNVIDLQLMSDQAISVKRLMFTKFQKFVWAYSIEEIILKFDERLMEMKTELIQKSSLFPPIGGEGAELIKYQAFNNMQTLYSKNISLDSQSSMKKYIDKFSDSFKKGCKIVEDRCSYILDQATEIKNNNLTNFHCTQGSEQKNNEKSK